MIFRDPLFLVFLLVIPPLIYVYFRSRGTNQVVFPSLEALKKIKPSFAQRYRHILIILRSTAIVLFVIALARPQYGNKQTKVTTEGIDIVLAVDVSGSMLAEDFEIAGRRYNRLHVVKQVVKDFIMKRTNDRIGLVVFAGRPYTQCPMTLDYGMLLQLLDKVEIGMVEDGTAIGSALGSSIERLKNTKAKSKVIILLTDGRNNSGEIDPFTAAEIARTFGIKIYAIGAGTKGLAPFPAFDIFGNKVMKQVKVDIDDDALREIARITDGNYYRATDTESLKEIYGQIDKLEKTESDVTQYTEYNELFHYFLLSAFGLLFVELGLAKTKLRKIP
ncbi:aerotolerance regulator BatA [Candidatus Brocadia sapporoensis]|uniref:Aerotolerance regulator BatA n=1 Tax=Candidatus Brocadia sapporoensis TaxID=392547 RepID=A0A1V6LZZ8_9BACT|nr:VWA domain-containing protein [Candidatus Brocadia sapporoensis]MDG6005770.1 VWA domain-containing protein [Candidatus Brocadia sp.]OQD45718.1 aerotolerance regulator BatA [Candidatus Brocadia sapporoensis]GJQ24776.1 MAG: aerotolerance protein BatA [Candidatus Brocadia sapporoensis]